MLIVIISCCKRIERIEKVKWDRNYYFQGQEKLETQSVGFGFRSQVHETWNLSCHESSNEMVRRKPRRKLGSVAEVRVLELGFWSELEKLGRKSSLQKRIRKYSERHNKMLFILWSYPVKNVIRTFSCLLDGSLVGNDTESAREIPSFS